MSRPPTFFGPYSPQGTGGVFAESSDAINNQHWRYSSGPQGTGGVFAEEQISNNSQQELTQDPGPEPGPPKRPPIPLWAKLCGCATIIIIIIIVIIVTVVFTRDHRTDYPPNSPANSASSSSSTLLPTLSPTSTTKPSTSGTSSPSTTIVPSPSTTIEPSPSTTIEPSPSTTIEPSPSTTIEPSPSTTIEPSPSITIEPSPSTTIEPSPSPTIEPSPSTTIEPSPSTTIEPSPSTTIEPSPSTAIEPSPSTTIEPSPSTTIEPSPSTTIKPSPSTPGGHDPFQPSDPQPTVMRPDRPRLIAPPYRWSQLPADIASNPCLQKYDSTIMSNANQMVALPPVSPSANATGPYDVPREVKMRIKALAYAYRMTGSEVWLNRIWVELQNIFRYAPVPSEPLGPPYPWQLPYFIDWYELTSALAIAYDWLFEFWTAEQRRQIEAMIIWAALSSGIRDFGLDNSTPAAWTTALGQENCISNAGISMGLLAIWDSFSSTWAGNAESAQQVFTRSLQSATNYCANSVSQDGTWVETPSAALAGTTAHAELAASLLAATGSTYGLINANSNFARVGLFQIYAAGNQGLFDYGDAETTPYSVTGNSLMFYATQYATPAYMLFQKDSPDAAADPWSMFWYDPNVSGELWNQLPLDHYFDAPQDSWASMRSSWTDNHGLYAAMKGGKLTGHSAEGDLDVGDFVIDALGERWAVELGSGMVNATGYSDSEAQDSPRWLYYRKRTEGQNTILINGQNQNVDASPTSKFGSSNTVQSSDAPFAIPADSTAFFTIDMSSAYGQGASVKRGIRLLNGRRQILLQDDISSSQGPIEWRMHTTAAVQVNGAVAMLTQNGQTMEIRIINPPDGAFFKTEDAVRLPSDPSLPPGTIDPPNSGVTVLSIVLPAGSYNLQVLFTPQWSDMSADHYVTPPFVAIDGWTLTSHG